MAETLICPSPFLINEFRIYFLSQKVKQVLT